jgi:hypothetical protein
LSKAILTDKYTLVAVLYQLQPENYNTPLDIERRKV